LKLKPKVIMELLETADKHLCYNSSSEQRDCFIQGMIAGVVWQKTRKIKKGKKHESKR
jgi:hypothetical protein